MKSKIQYLKIFKNITFEFSINDHPYSINFWDISVVETTIIGNTAELAKGPEDYIDTLHKEGKSQNFILKGVAV